MKTIIEPHKNPIETIEDIKKLCCPLLGMETKNRQRYVMSAATSIEKPNLVCWQRVGGGIAFDFGDDITGLVTQALRSPGVLKVVRFESLAEMANWINGH